MCWRGVSRRLLQISFRCARCRSCRLLLHLKLVGALLLLLGDERLLLAVSLFALLLKYQLCFFFTQFGFRIRFVVAARIVT